MADFVWTLAVSAALLVTMCVSGVAALRLGIHGLQVWCWRWSLVAFELRLPRTTTTDDVARWVGALRAMLPGRRWWSLLPRRPICLEITATRRGVSHVLVIPRRSHAGLQAALAAVLPGARLTELSRQYFDLDLSLRRQVAAEARLKSTGGLLATDRGTDVSRYLLAALQPLNSGEVARVQWLLTGALPPRWATDPRIPPSMVPEYVKHSDPLLLAVCRIGVSSRLGRRRARAVHARVWAALRGMNTPGARIGRRWWLPSSAVAVRLMLRTVPRGRWPMVTTAKELGGLLGLISGEALPGVAVPVSRTLPPSPAMSTRGLVVAASNYPGMRTPLCLGRSDRLRHLWMIGPTGSGKSTLLANMACYDIHHGDGLVVIDPRGDLIGDILDRVPPERADDVIVIDPTEGEHVVGMNPLAAGPPEQAAGFCYHVLHSLYRDSWGPRTADIARACLLTLTSTKASNGQAFTLVDIPELLTNTGFRRSVTSQSLMPQLASFWRWYETMPTAQQLTVISPVLNKLRTFTLSTPLRTFLGQSSGIDFHDVMAHKRVVLVALKKGLLGADTSGLIGALVMSSVWQATLSRANLPSHRRRPFWLYIDEFQDVVRLPLDLADMCAQARGLGLGLTLAHQFLGQLSGELKGSIIGTVRSHLVYQVGHTDAKELAASFEPLTADDLRHLGAYEIALRPCVGGTTLRPVTGTTYPLPKPTTDGAALAQASRRHYGTARADVDAAIAARIRGGDKPVRIGRSPRRNGHPEGPWEEVSTR